MLCSAGFHMFGCHSEKASRRWLAVDLGGILIGVIGCYLPAVHYAFYCLSVSMTGFYAPNFEKVGSILVSACPFVRSSFRPIKTEFKLGF